MAHAQKPHFVFRRNGRVNLNRQGYQFSRLLLAEMCVSAAVILDTCSEVVWRVLATHSIGQFPLHFPSRASPCAIIFQLESTATTVFLSAAVLWSAVPKILTGLPRIEVGIVPTSPQWQKVAQTVWLVPDAVITVICATYDGRSYHPKHVEQVTEI
jgi:hypothetical protein